LITFNFHNHFIFVGIITANIRIWHWNSQWVMILSQFSFWIDPISLKSNEVKRLHKWNDRCSSQITMMLIITSDLNLNIFHWINIFTK
jgi:hypothetical protein